LGDVGSCHVDYLHEPVVDDDVLSAAAAQPGVRVDFVLFPSEGIVSTEGEPDHKDAENELDSDVDQLDNNLALAVLSYTTTSDSKDGRDDQNSE